MGAFLLFALFVAASLPLLGSRRRERVVRWVFRTVLRAIGARLEIHGQRHLDGSAGRHDSLRDGDFDGLSQSGGARSNEH